MKFGVQPKKRATAFYRAINVEDSKTEFVKMNKSSRLFG